MKAAKSGYLNPVERWNRGGLIAQEQDARRRFFAFQGPLCQIPDDPPVEILQSAYFRIGLQGTKNNAPPLSCWTRNHSISRQSTAIRKVPRDLPQTAPPWRQVHGNGGIAANYQDKAAWPARTLKTIQDKTAQPPRNPCCVIKNEEKIRR
jgi:hypothetical protein